MILLLALCRLKLFEWAQPSIGGTTGSPSAWNKSSSSIFALIISAIFLHVSPILLLKVILGWQRFGSLMVIQGLNHWLVTTPEIPHVQHVELGNLGKYKRTHFTQWFIDLGKASTWPRRPQFWFPRYRTRVSLPPVVAAPRPCQSHQPSWAKSN